MKERNTVNQRQAEFYDNKRKNLPTRIWSYFRNGVLNKTKKGVGIERDIYNLHRLWFGDLKDKKVLDLGCYEGNSLSIYLAENAAEYLAIDLSPKGIDSLSHRLRNISRARAEAVDFLSEQFKEKDFDLIYAYGVLHHFENVDELILKLNKKLKPGGAIISHDPLQTSLPVKIIRAIYRPFQSDREWEWPFTRETYYKFNREFKVIERRAVLGKTKWLPFLNLLPGFKKKKLEKAQKWHKEDWERSMIDDDYMFSCMHLSMLMEKRAFSANA